MGATLLIRHSGASWNEWAKSHQGDHIVLDPSDATHGIAARLVLVKGGKPAMVRFYGSLDSQRSPHVILAALHEFLEHCENPVIHCPVYRPSPVLRQNLQLIAGMVKPREILVARGTQLSLEGWPVGPEILDLPDAFPKIVLDAQRKAQWLSLVERSHPHEIPLQTLTIEGTRLGSGEMILEDMREKAGLKDTDHVEVCGSTLLVICGHELEDAIMARALDVTHTARAMVVSVREYDNLLCALVRESGEEIGHGMIDKFDFANGVVKVWADAVPPVPVRVLKLGSLRVDRNGKEFGEMRAWSG